ncbi:MAG: tetratricopeptide repeat protein [Cylindrospermopsis raciborskii KL1]|uniref:tetratricopeptide repeat protein n=1 Tax=Cylindrospermopsis raciborskii TaxID=77022 RepID=UPI001A31BD93|nr:tetratricopeptide repeat protein [Cylindrospermopsis raciborskii]MBG0742454.1 tetratricopeptide repeat protein [Cylindrospermopsis raciborskii KL1]
MANVVGKIRSISNINNRNIHSVITNMVCMIVLTAVSNIMGGCGKNVLSNNMDYSSTSSSPIFTPSPTFTSSSKSKNAGAKLRQLGLRYRQQGRYADAIISLEKATSMEPENLSGQVLLGWTLHLAGREASAMKVLEQVLEKDGNYIPALNSLGIVYLVSGDLDKAVTTHERAKEIKANNEIAYYNLTLAYQRLKKYDLAIARGKQATILEPTNPHPWVALALVYWGQGMKTQARQTYNQAVRLDSRYGQSRFLINLKQAGFSQEQIDNAREIVKIL